MKEKRISKAGKLLITFFVFVLLIAGVVVSCSLRNESEKSETPQTKAAEEEKTDKPPAVAVDRGPMLTMGVGEKLRLSPDDAAFSSDNTDVVSVDDADNDLTAAATGYATVTRTLPDGTADKYYVTVKSEPAAVTFSSAKMMMQTGEQAQLFLLPASAEEGFAGATFSSDNSDVVAVNDDGTASAKSPGTATVTAVCYNGASASLEITVLDNTGYTERTTIASTDLMADARWSAPKLKSVSEDSTVQEYGSSDDGRWRKVKYGDVYGWMYNKAFEETVNYSDYTLETLPVMADDLIFDIGTDKRDIFDFVYQIAYYTNEDDTTENLCVDYFNSERGSCYTHAAMLCYLYNRCGYETLRLVGESAYEGAGVHSWCLTKTEDGWKHYDAQKFTIREADEQFGVNDETYYSWFHWDLDNTPRAE